MTKRFILIALLSAAVYTLQASVITLRNGQKIQGEVVLQNDEVVIVRNSSGARFQYPAAEVVSVTDDDNISESETDATQATDDKPQGKKMTILVGLTGGGAIIPQDCGGGTVGGELMIGSKYIGKKDIFLGGGISVHGMFLNGQTYTFLPLQVGLKVPFIDCKHTPFVGANVGYGFGVSKNCVGGIYTAAEVGYRYTINTRAALLLSIRAQFQQAKVDATETITENGLSTDYTGRVGRSLVTCGAYLAFSF